MLRRMWDHAPIFFEVVLLGMKSFELIQQPVGTIDISQLYLVSKALTQVKVEDPLLLPQLNVVLKVRAILVVGHGRADPSPGAIEISLSLAKLASSSGELIFERFDPRFRCRSHPYFLN